MMVIVTVMLSQESAPLTLPGCYTAVKPAADGAPLPQVNNETCLKVLKIHLILF